MSAIRLILTKRGNEIERNFDASLKATVFGEALDALNKKGILKNEFPEVPALDLVPDADIFQKPQGVPWYLDAIGRELFKNAKKQYRLQVKGCEGFLFIRLWVRTAGAWELLLRPFFHASQLPSKKDTNKKRRDEALRGLADTLLFIAPELHSKSVNVRELFDWCNIDIETSCVESTSDRLILSFTPSATVYTTDVEPGKKSFDIEDLNGSAMRVLVASRNVRTAVKDLAEVWHNPIPRSVLLSAWTGSGKEVLKSLFVYACLVPQKRVVEFAAPELAGSPDRWKRIVNELKARRLFNLKDKRISKHSILFLDEIHHPEVAELRSGLLRSMETDKVAFEKCGVETKLLTYLFAASKSPEQLREVPPPDFWTRIEYNVVMRHPLLLAGSERRDALRQYFCLFWRKAAEKRRDESPQYVEVLGGRVAEISETFVDVLGSPLIPMISMRTIRSIVSRLFGRALYLAQTEQPDQDDLVKGIRLKFDDWATEICHQIVPELKPEGVF
jgi:hypothetical protein